MSLAAARKILKRLGVRASVVARLPGRTDEVYDVRVSPRRRYLLRLRNPFSMNERAARVQQEWLAAIAHETDLVVPQVLHVREDAALFTWVVGEGVSSARAFVTRARLAAVGETAAKLHRHAASLQRDSFKGVTRLDEEHFLGNMPRELNRWTNILR